MQDIDDLYLVISIKGHVVNSTIFNVDVDRNEIYPCHKIIPVVLSENPRVTGSIVLEQTIATLCSPIPCDYDIQMKVKL